MTFIKIVGLTCIIRIVSTISQYFLSLGMAERPLRAPGRQETKSSRFAIGRHFKLVTFGSVPGARKSRPIPLVTVRTRGQRSPERIMKIIRMIRFIKIIGLICIIRIISTISQYLISSGPVRRPLRAPGRQGPKSGQFLLTAYCKMTIVRSLATRNPRKHPGRDWRNRILADSADDPDDVDKPAARSPQKPPGGA